MSSESAVILGVLLILLILLGSVLLARLFIAIIVPRKKPSIERATREKAEEERLRKAREEQAKAERLSQQHSPTQLPTTPEPLHKDLLHCTQCYTVYEEGDAFCKKCGLALTVSGTKTDLATQTTCPNCSASVLADATFCPKCGSAVSLPGITDATVLVNTPPTRTILESLVAVDTQAETRAATTSARICPSCHRTVELGPEDRFCGNCGYRLA